MAGIPAQTSCPPAVAVLAELSSFLTVFGLDVRLGESALLTHLLCVESHTEMGLLPDQ